MEGTGVEGTVVELPGLSLVEPRKATLNQKLVTSLDGWIASEPGTSVADTPAQMIGDAAAAFTTFTNTKSMTSSDVLNRFELALNAAGFRGGFLYVGGNLRWLLCLPGHRIRGLN